MARVSDGQLKELRDRIVSDIQRVKYGKPVECTSNTREYFISLINALDDLNDIRYATDELFGAKYDIINSIIGSLHLDARDFQKATDKLRKCR